MIKAYCSYDKVAWCFGTVTAKDRLDLENGVWLSVDDEYTKHSTESDIEILEVLDEYSV